MKRFLLRYGLQTQSIRTGRSCMSAATEITPRGLVARVGTAVARHRRAVLIGWLVLIIGALGLSSGLGAKYANNFSLPGTESQRAADLLARDFPAQAGDS